MASKSSKASHLGANQKRTEDRSMWETSTIIRTKRYNQPEHVVCFRGDSCVYDSDQPLVSPAVFEKVFEKVANSIGEGEPKDVTSYREGVLNGNFNTRI